MYSKKGRDGNMGKNTVKENFPVLDMTCAACAARVDKALNNSKGVKCATVNLASNTATVEYDPAVCSPEALKANVVAAGYDLVIEKEAMKEDRLDAEHARKMRKLRNKLIFSLVFSIPVSVISMFFPDIPYAGYIMLVLSTAVLVWPASGIYASAFRLLKHFSSNMDTLVATSTGVAYVFSVFNLFFPEFWLQRGVEPHLYFEASSMVVSFILLGRWLEERAKGKASSAIRELMGLQPDTVSVLSEGGLMKTISVEQVRVGDTVVVKPGERVAVDGTVVKGDSYVDESMLNGEPLPSHKFPGEKVYAGSVNKRGALHFKAEKVGEGTLLSRIIALVREAQGSKAPVQKLVDRIAAVFVPVIVCIAVVSAVIWLLADSAGGVTHALLAFVTVLVIACPCALGLATPTAIMVGVGKAARNGILVKDAASIEIAKKVDTVVLDKTGTITEGHPAVTDVFWSNEGDSRRYAAILKSLESLSEHPLAEAVASYFDCDVVEVGSFEAVPGMGVKGICPAPACGIREGDHDGTADAGEVGDAGGMSRHVIKGSQETEYYIGNRAMMSDAGVSIPVALEERAAGLASEAKSVVWFAGKNVGIIALIGVADKIKETSVEAISRLQGMGIKVHMLTGDSRESAAYIAGVCGITEYRAGVLPDEKSEYVKALRSSGKVVAMVGDGINDSAALAQADLSMAMGGGSDIAMDVAGVTIVSSDLRKIPDAIRISSMTVRTIRENLFWAFIYNLIGVPIAAGVLYPFNGFLLSPMIASAAMAFSSVSVVTNSLRLGMRKLWPGKQPGVPVSADSIPVPPYGTGEEDNKEFENKVGKNNNEGGLKMKKEYEITGMMCMNCRRHVENALNSIQGVHAAVTLEPPVAVIEFDSAEVPVNELQKRLSEEGDYTIKAK